MNSIVDIVVDDNCDNGIEAFPVFIEEDDERKINFIPSDDEVELPNNSRLTPLTIMTADTIGAVQSRVVMKVLLDSGSTGTFISRKCLPRNCKPFKIKTARPITTIAGKGIASEMVILRDL